MMGLGLLHRSSEPSFHSKVPAIGDIDDFKVYFAKSLDVR